MNAFLKSALCSLCFIVSLTVWVSAQSADTQTNTEEDKKKDPPPAYLLPTITVNGSFDPEHGPTTPVSTPYGTQFNVVTEKQIKEQGSPDFLDTMRNVPGVMFSKHNAAGTSTGTSLYIRGRGYTHPSLETTTYFDGVPRYGLVYGQSMADGIPVSAIGSIEVYKYPQPSRFGAGYAFVNVTPKYRTMDGMELQTGGSAGSYKAFTENSAFGYRKEWFDIYAAQSLSSSQGHIIHSEAKQHNYYLNTGFRFSEHWNLRVLGNFVYAKTEKPPYKGQSKRDILQSYKTNTEFGTITLNNEYGIAKGFFKLYVNHTDFRILDEELRIPGDWSKQELMAYGAKLKETFNFFKGNEIVTGLDLDYSNTKNEDHNTTRPSVISEFPDMRLISPYAATSQNFQFTKDFRVIPSAGVRLYNHNLWSNSVAPQMGLVAGYGNTELNYNYALGVIYPAPANIQSFVNSPDYSNTALKDINPEIVHHYEGGITHNWPLLYGREIGGSISASGFYDDGRDRIIQNSSTSLVPENASRVSYFRITGLEASASLCIEKDYLLLNRFDIYTGTTWIANIKARGENGKVIDKMPYTPTHSVSAGFKWTLLKRLRLSGDYQLQHNMYAGSIGRDATFTTPSRKIDDIQLANMRISYGFEIQHVADVELYFNVSNVFDKKYEYYIGYEMPGTTFKVGADLKFFI